MKQHKNERGVILVGAMIVTLFFMVTSLAVAELSVTHFISTKRTLVAASADAAADAAADAFAYKINTDSSYVGTNTATAGTTNTCSATPTPVTLFSTASQGKITYQSCVTPGGLANEKYVYLTSKVYIPANAASPKVTRKLRLVLQSSTSAGSSYTVQTGNGGLYLTNNASVGAGDLYINGRLKLDNNATIGDASHVKASHVWVAGYGCGSGASFPMLCPGTTGQNDLPIYLYSAHVYADVHSPNMTNPNYDATHTLALLTNNGLIDGVAPQVAMPDDYRSTVMGRNSWTTRAASTANCSSGSITWAGGTHFTGGDINVSNNCTVTVTGDIWIDGALQLSNNAVMKVGNGISVQPNILIDGQNGFRPSNNASMIANSSDVTFRVNTYWSKNGICSVTCSTPTGQNLQDSENTETMTFSNNFTGAGATFDAVWSKLHVSNNANVGQLIGQYIVLDNNGNITFSGGSVTNGGITTWNVTHYEQIY